MVTLLENFIEKNKGSLLWIAIGLVVVIFLLISIMNSFVKRHRLKKQIRDLEKKYEFGHSLLVGQCSFNLKRVYSISNYNLLYHEVYSELLKDYEDLMQTRHEQAENALNMLKNCLDHSKGKSNKENIKRNKACLLDYFQQIEKFDKRLNAILEKEEEAKEKSLNQKEAVRALKQNYHNHKDELSLVEESFEVLFKNIDDAFRKYDEAIDCANYDEVNNILVRIESVIKELDPIMKDLPLLCAKLTSVVPNKIALLRHHADEMISNGYQLSHLHVSSTIDDYEKRIDNVKKHLLALDIDGCNDEMDKILVNIDELISQIEKEKDAKEQYESKKDTIYKNVRTLNDKFIQIYNLVPNIKTQYVIETNFLNEIEVINYNISQIDTVRRTLDSYIHSLSKQPYSILNNKSRQLEELTIFATQKLNNFSSYLLSLEDDFNNSVDIIKDGYIELKKYKAIVHNLSVNSYEVGIEAKFDDLFRQIDKINSLLNVKPINIKAINELVLKFTEDKTKLINMIDEDKNYMTITENLVVYANKYRHHSTEIANLFTQIETSFFDGEFERSYMDACSATKKIKNTTETI